MSDKVTFGVEMADLHEVLKMTPEQEFQIVKFKQELSAINCDNITPDKLDQLKHIIIGAATYKMVLENVNRHLIKKVA
jgi:hypothetical protein